MKYKTAFRLGVKLIGLFLIGSNIGWLISFGAGFAISFLTGDFGSPILSYQFSYVLNAGIGVALGLYLLCGARWITNLAIPGNRPYCHECAYELTGLPGEGRCPECGTEYRRDLRDPDVSDAPS